jgi:hypothetical protein
MRPIELLRVRYLRRRRTVRAFLPAVVAGAVITAGLMFLIVPWPVVALGLLIGTAGVLLILTDPGGWRRGGPSSRADGDGSAAVFWYLAYIGAAAILWYVASWLLAQLPR